MTLICLPKQNRKVDSDISRYKVCRGNSPGQRSPCPSSDDFDLMSNTAAVPSFRRLLHFVSTLAIIQLLRTTTSRLRAVTATPSRIKLTPHRQIRPPRVFKAVPASLAKLHPELSVELRSYLALEWKPFSNMIAKEERFGRGIGMLLNIIIIGSTDWRAHWQADQ